MWRASVCAAALLAVAQPGCAIRQREPLRIGMNVWPPYELLSLAKEQGFFTEEGVEVDLVDFSSYTGVLRSYHQENIDGFLATLNELQVRENFQDLPAVVLVADYSDGGDALVVRGGITTLGDLRGKKVAFEESALGSYFLERILETARLAPGEVTAVNRLPEEGEEDFRRGTVDAVITYEPRVGRLLQKPGSRVIFTSRQLKGEILDVLALRRSVLEGRREEVRRLVRAWFRALDYLKAHPRQAGEVMARRERASAEEFLRSLQGTHIPDLAENRALLGSPLSPGTLHQTADRLGEFLVRRGLTQSPASGAELVHPEIVGSL